MTKWKTLLSSRKFWASVFGLVAVSSSAWTADAVETAKIIDAIIIIIGIYVGSTAIEDAGHAIGRRTNGEP